MPASACDVLRKPLQHFLMISERLCWVPNLTCWHTDEGLNWGLSSYFLAFDQIALLPLQMH